MYVGEFFYEYGCSARSRQSFSKRTYLLPVVLDMYVYPSTENSDRRPLNSIPASLGGYTPKSNGFHHLSAEFEVSSCDAGYPSETNNTSCTRSTRTVLTSSGARLACDLIEREIRVILNLLQAASRVTTRRKKNPVKAALRNRRLNVMTSRDTSAKPRWGRWFSRRLGVPSLGGW